ncbi:hypothetical protein CEY16_06900 [Halalkalibacillus sediminis]|uniref:Uncharacterized protein n=1 Tax=Halalkalibacillus sediminis TaxID=2018042 RepID=A0A2I0QTI7_9BACI|nr:hypothetical protein [Halalkalibacillus sediminis]PKR77657.1 hypothetical protein CEY16_06900 [Halalkalibacillus sediminis]
MFGIITIILILLVVYFTVEKESKKLKTIVSFYFGLVAAIFFGGAIYINFKYQLNTGPVLEGGFQAYFEWVSWFAVLFIVPLAILMIYKAHKLLTKRFVGAFSRYGLLTGFVIIITLSSYAAFYGFILTVYGFAP